MPWTIENHTTLDKRFKVEGPGDVTLYVDYDDVDHESVDRETQHLVEILNAYAEPPEPELTQRGFKHYPPFITDHGHTVMVYESSAAMQPCLWLNAERGPEACRGGLKPEEATLHLTVPQAMKLIAALSNALANHYQNA